jgi:hypothetical protein
VAQAVRERVGRIVDRFSIVTRNGGFAGESRPHRGQLKYLKGGALRFTGCLRESPEFRIILLLFGRQAVTSLGLIADVAVRRALEMDDSRSSAAQFIKPGSFILALILPGA